MVGRVLTDEAEHDRAAFDLELADEGCTCFISPPCSYCTHPGNPLNLEGDDAAWRELSTYERYQAARNELFPGDEEGGMAQRVWDDCSPEARESMARQMEEGVERKRIKEAAMPEGWGAW